VVARRELFDIDDSRNFLAWRRGAFYDSPMLRPFRKPVSLMTCNCMVLKVTNSPNFHVQNHLILNSGYRHDAVNYKAYNSMIILRLGEVFTFSQSF